MNDFRPTADLETLRFRAALLGRTRTFFNERDFVEVTTPVLSEDTVVDEHLDPLTTILFADPRHPDSGAKRYLQTSPEFHMKRLVAAGMRKIYQIGPAFRAAESGDRHNTEFTMIEWYRVGDDMQAGMELLSDLAMALIETNSVDRIRYADAFQQYAEVHPFETPHERIREICGEVRTVNNDDSRDDCLNLLWSHHVEPQLGIERPVIVFHYPASQAALARTKTVDGAEVAERFELYFRGIELANGYHELTDAEELLRRNHRVNDLRARAGKSELPINSRLIEAMQNCSEVQPENQQNGLPPCAGVALGFDRLMMAISGKPTIADVMAFTDRNA